MKIIVKENEERLDKYLANNTEYSRNLISKMLDKDLITVNNKFEKVNSEFYKKAGALDEYKYLTSENKRIKQYSELYDIYKANNDSLPDETWQKIIS